MEKETERLLKKYSEKMQELQKEIQGLKHALSLASMAIKDDPKDQDRVYNELKLQGQKYVEVLYGKNN